MKLIVTTENYTDDAIKIHICTTLSKSYDRTIQIPKQPIPTPTAQNVTGVLNPNNQYNILLN
jgi:hypothetical protein